MTPKSFAILAATTVVAVIAGVAVNMGGPAYRSGTGGNLLFPGFADKVNDAAKVIVQTAKHKFTIERKGNGWAVADKYDYPAKYDLVKQTLVGLAELKTIEAKTAEPSLYTRLEVEDVTSKDAKSAEITVEDAKGAKLASLILGKRHFSRGADTENQLYVRKVGEVRSWLAAGTLERNDDMKPWLDRELVTVARERVHEVTVTPAGDKAFEIDKAKPGESSFTLQGVPPDDKVKSPYEVDAVASGIEALFLDDVLPAKDLKVDAKLLRTLTYKTFDGMTVNLSIYEQAGKKWARITAAVDEKDAKAKQADPKLKNAAEVKKAVEAINARAKDWVYGLASSDLVSLEKKFTDLVEPKEKPKPKS